TSSPSTFSHLTPHSPINSPLLPSSITHTPNPSFPYFSFDHFIHPSTSFPHFPRNVSPNPPEITPPNP
ncbi:hypothetical protein, partial [Micrococcus luteus]|uniref:hypothetical protein n=1 Tax=Micrococcus luteus TaxID=1270 RepID=UPI001C92D20B